MGSSNPWTKAGKNIELLVLDGQRRYLATQVACRTSKRFQVEASRGTCPSCQRHATARSTETATSVQADTGGTASQHDYENHERETCQRPATLRLWPDVRVWRDDAGFLRSPSAARHDDG